LLGKSPSQASQAMLSPASANSQVLFGNGGEDDGSFVDKVTDGKDTHGNSFGLLLTFMHVIHALDFLKLTYEILVGSFFTFLFCVHELVNAE
jgi:hypothetical protein